MITEDRRISLLIPSVSFPMWGTHSYPACINLFKFLRWIQLTYWTVVVTYATQLLTRCHSSHIPSTVWLTAIS